MLRGRTMSEHTPGPWEIHPQLDSCYRDISAPKHIALAQVVWRFEEEDRSPECEANAHLIAAAPDLLGALNSLLEYLHEYDLDYPEAAPVFDKARAAIAKARGD